MKESNWQPWLKHGLKNEDSERMTSSEFQKDQLKISAPHRDGVTNQVDAGVRLGFHVFGFAAVRLLHFQVKGCCGGWSQRKSELQSVRKYKSTQALSLLLQPNAQFVQKLSKISFFSSQTSANKQTKMEWGKQHMERLVNLVRENPGLYDQTDPHYKDNNNNIVIMSWQSFFNLNKRNNRVFDILFI